MRRFTLFLLVLFSTTLFAQVDQKLPNGKWAYYGEDFYKVLDSGIKFDRFLFDKILNSGHAPVKGRPDQVSMNCSNNSCYGHTPVSYDEARKIMFGTLDILKDNHGTYVLDVYCGEKFYFKNLNEVSQMHTQVNIEHTWPQSRFSNRYPKDMQKADMHHLYLTDSMANNVRGNSEFGFENGYIKKLAYNGCESSNFMGNKTVYTPPTNHRGNVARSLFYFSMHYNLPISKSEEAVLREWHKADPVDAAEVRRHEMIAKIQKVRNPFVDHPQIVDRVDDF